MSEDYKKSVLDFYHQKRIKGTLSVNLSNLAPAKLRDECIIVYKERPADDDNETLRTFFGPKNNVDGFLSAIKAIDIDRFRPVKSFVTRITSNPEPRVIELLAWLIDFQIRPYQSWQLNPDGIPKPQVGSDRPIPVPVPPLRPILKFKVKIALISLLIISAIGIIAYQNKDIEKQCMYWTGDHYQAIAYNEVAYQREIIALDTMKLAHFRKINCPDTLTRSALGKVFYVKINNVPEFYTSDGYHPIEHKKMLRPVTLYMLNKYCMRKDCKI